MTQSSRPRGALTGYFDRATGTVARCHLCGATAAILLTLGTMWSWSLGGRREPTVVCQGREIHLDDATALVENASQWRELYARNFRTQETLDGRIAKIGRWLPHALEWEAIEDRLHETADAHGLRLHRVKTGSEHVGTRVAVLDVICETSGSYAAHCRFLDALAKDPFPIACSSVRLQRSMIVLNQGESPQRLTDRNRNQTCRASLTLRVPFASSQSVAAKLLAEAPDAS